MALIGDVQVSRTSVEVGESLLVEVTLVPGAPEDTLVAINGVPGRRQHLAFTLPGEAMPLRILAAQGETAEVATRQVEVRRPADPGAAWPLVRVSSCPFGETAVEFRVENAAAFPDATYYWEFGDGEFARTAAPYAVHDYVEAVAWHSERTAFDARLALRRPGVERQTRFTVTVDNLWWKPGSSRRLLRVIGGTAGPDGGRMVARLTLRNPFRDGANLRRAVIRFLHGPANQQANRAAPLELPVEIALPPYSYGTVAVAWPETLTPGTAHGALLRLEGKDEGNFEVAGERMVDFAHRPWPGQPLAARVQQTLTSLAQAMGRPSPDGLTARHFYQALHGGVGNAGALVGLLTDIAGSLRDPSAPPGPVERCDPDGCRNASHPPGMICQQRKEDHYIEWVPARLNAFAGEVLLSPGGMGPISKLLKAIGQTYSHAGMMTRDFCEVTHATASETWLRDHPRGVKITQPVTLDLSDQPVLGHQEHALRHVWPGVVRQDIDCAMLGEARKGPGHPSGSYELRAFEFLPTARSTNAEALHPPLVVRPRSGMGSLTGQARQALAQAADEARGWAWQDTTGTWQTKGHYSFYAYTDADLAYRYSAPASPPDWSSGTRPVVCSSFIWTVLRDSGQLLEGAHDPLQPGDTEPGESADPQTRDGLYLYDEASRSQAAQVLYDTIVAEARSTFEAAVGVSNDLLTNLASILEAAGVAAAGTSGLPEAVAANVANQICNTFAFNDTHAGAGPRWRQPGPGRAVSPDDIAERWDVPVQPAAGAPWGLFGEKAPLQYTPGMARAGWHGVVLPVYGSTELKGQVRYRGENVSGATVTIACQEVKTTPEGFAVLVPGGTYAALAHAPVPLGEPAAEKRWTASGSLWLDCSVPPPAVLHRIDNVIIELRDPPQLRRFVAVVGTIRILEDDPDDELRAQAVQMAVRLDSATPVETRHLVHYGEDETRVEYELTFSLDLRTFAVSCACHGKFFEGTSLDTGDLEAEQTTGVDVPQGQQRTLTQKLENDEAASDDHASIEMEVWNMTG